MAQLQPSPLTQAAPDMPPVTGNQIPGRAYLFIVADEILPTRKVVRRIFTLDSPRIQLLLAHEPVKVDRMMFPERWGLTAWNPWGRGSVSEHIRGATGGDTPWISASTLVRGASYKGRLISLPPTTSIRRA